jgi:hypothetical protein
MDSVKKGALSLDAPVAPTAGVSFFVLGRQGVSNHPAARFRTVRRAIALLRDGDVLDVKASR